MSVVSYEQLLRTGWTPQSVRTAVDHGAIRRVRKGWYDTGDDPFALLGAVLADEPRAYGSHVTAAAVLGAVAVPRRTDVTVPHGSRMLETPRLHVHRSTAPMAAVTVDGLRITTPVRTVLDLARVSDPVTGVVVADAMLHRGLCRREDLVGALPSVYGLRGARLARRAVDLCRVGAQSPAETRARLVVTAGGLPEPVLQYPVVVDAGLTYFLDLAWPSCMVCLEYDGHAHHSEPADVTADRVRWRTLHDLGWDVRPITAAELRSPRALVSELGTALRVGAAAHAGARSLLAA